MNIGAQVRVANARSSSARAGVAFIALLGILLLADAAGILEKRGGLFANPHDGVISDAIRLLVFFAAGAFAAGLRRNLLTAALWTLGLNLIDKTFVALRVGWIANDSVSSLNLFLGVTGIYALTVPLLLAVAFIGYYSVDSLLASNAEPRKSKPQANVLLAASAAASIVYYVFALNSYMLLWIADFPVFYLSLSQQAVRGLFYACVAVAVAAVSVWLIGGFKAKDFRAWPRVLLAGVLLGVAVGAHFSFRV